ncbi:MAG: tRNA (N6-isopentenyl adenosine(37)-C2)-methylthiotransferase MiaB [Faecousia sp.]
MNTKTTVISQAELDTQFACCDKIAAYWQAKGITPVAFVETYGCQQNEADSEKLRGYLAQCGYAIVQEAEGADVVIMNTCAIREHAEQRVFGNLGALTHTKRRHPEQKIFLCGCMAGETKVSDRIKKSYPHVDGVFSTHHLWQFPEILWNVLSGKKRQFFITDEPGSIAEGIPQVRDSKLKAWVSIMYGCNNFCTYCIVPYVRGRERSRKFEDILKECRELIANGAKDITLLGQNVNSYGKDLPEGKDFADLLAAIAQLPGDFLIRFMTSHPRDASEKLFDTMAKYPKIAKQLHLPFQSGSSRVLKAMNRHYDRETYLQKVLYAKKVMPDLVLTSDVIVGFPGETEEEFEETISLIQQVHYDSLFTFIFSPRPGTPAASMDDPTPKEEKNRRFDKLCAVQNAISEEIHNNYIGKQLRCLVDGRDKDMLTARTEGGRLVRFASDDSLIGTYRNLTITGATTWSLTGEDTIARFVRESGLDIPEYDAYAYGYPEMADEILAALLRGDKRATTGLKCLYELEKEPLPQAGQYSVILDSKGAPHCITRITKIEITPFRDISEEYAFIEGEGDKSLSYWKDAHREVFTRECREDFRMEFSEDMDCVCEYFEVVYQK